MSISQTIEAQNLRNLYNADIVVYIPLDEDFNDGTACVAAIGPIDHFAYMILPLDESLNDYTFPHEFGHILGGRHNSNSNNPATCGRGFRLELGFTEFYFTAITGTPFGFERIPHYSNPEVTWKFVPTGEIDSMDPSSSKNNAGKINTNSCVVGDFRTNSTSISSNIIVTEQNCQLHLEAVVDVPNSNFTHEWLWSQDGLFNTNSPGFNLGTGNNLSIDEPVSDNCSFYFINLKVLENNEVVSTSTINIQSGTICIDNVQPCSGTSNSISRPTNPNAPTTQDVNSPITNPSEKLEFRLFSISGQHLTTFNSYPSNLLLSQFITDSGIFVLQEIKNGILIRTQKITIYED